MLLSTTPAQNFLSYNEHRSIEYIIHATHVRTPSTSSTQSFHPRQPSEHVTPHRHAIQVSALPTLTIVAQMESQQATHVITYRTPFFKLKKSPPSTCISYQFCLVNFYISFSDLFTEKQLLCLAIQQIFKNNIKYDNIECNPNPCFQMATGFSA